MPSVETTMSKRLETPGATGWARSAQPGDPNKHFIITEGNRPWKLKTDTTDWGPEDIERNKTGRTVDERIADQDLMDVIDIPWGEVRDPHSLEQQPTLKHRQMIVQIDDRAGGTRPMAQSPYRFSNASSGVRGPAAHRGEHNRAVLKDWLQWSDGEINELIAASLLTASDAVTE